MLVSAPLLAYLATSRHHDSPRRDLQRLVPLPAVYLFCGQIVDGSTGGEYRSGAQDRAFPDDCSLVHTAIPADQDIVLYDDRESPDGFQYTPDLAPGADVHALSDLRARSDQRMGIYHGAVINIST